MLLAHVFKLVPALLEESEIGVCHRIRTARKQTSVQRERCTAMFTHHSLCVCVFSVSLCRPTQQLFRHVTVWTILTSGQF